MVEANGSVSADVIACRKGDRHALERLLRRALELALRTAGALLRDRSDAGDVAQDVAVVVIETLDRLREPAAFDGWVHGITVRIVLRRLGRRRGRERAEAYLAARARPGGKSDVPSGVATRASLVDALARLPVRQRLALTLRYVHDLSDQDIADALNCRVGTVHALLSRGRAALRQDSTLAEIAESRKGALGASQP